MICSRRRPRRVFASRASRSNSSGEHDLAVFDCHAARAQIDGERADCCLVSRSADAGRSSCRHGAARRGCARRAREAEGLHDVIVGSELESKTRSNSAPRAVSTMIGTSERARSARHTSARRRREAEVEQHEVEAVDGASAARPVLASVTEKPSRSSLREGSLIASSSSTTSKRDRAETESLTTPFDNDCRSPHGERTANGN